MCPALRLLILLNVATAFGAHAQVVDADPAGFTSVHEMTLAATPARVYQALTAEIGRWWDPRHSYSGIATNFTLDPRPGGCFCEALADGGGVEHLRVVYVDPNRLLRLSGGLGPLQSMAVAGSMDFALEDAGEGSTRLSYRYTVGGYYPDGLDTLSGAVDLVQLGQLQRLKRYLESGNPELPDAT